MYNKFILVMILMFFCSNLALADVAINEIMYDLDGTDTDREWLEIYNNSSNPIDLSGYKFFEANTNHELVALEGETNLGANGYAVIASDPIKFKADWPNFSGLIFNSSFSLNNTGETIAIKDASLNIVSQYTYDSASGGAGDGDSLQLINSEWRATTPTPGAENAPVVVSPPVSDDENGGNVSSSSSSGSSSLKETVPEPKMTVVQKTRAQITIKPLAYVGIPFMLEGKAFGHQGEQLFRGRYFWNFGDGDSRETKVINADKFVHTYFYPDDYTIILEYFPDAFADVPEAVEKVTVKVVTVGVSISSVGNEKDFFIELTNNTDYNTDLSGWLLQSNYKSFTLPRNTTLGAKGKMIISPKISGFSIEDKDTLKLMTSQGEIVPSYSAPVVPVQKISNITKPANLKDSIDENKQFSSENLTALAIGNDALTETDNPKSVSIISIISFLFIGASASTVYFIRRKRISPQAESDFEILDE